ncbi:hypothetical protein KOW79_012183 [Hemibagrus wyckioides]|uniref:Midkine n=2 Tax=Hemibagrus wyckioides TaxID=337641 RepID=A0A9D3NNN1_9TELE|nr:hypothetical protein KOW79_012183 [Hemibagrus wyckioides]
MKLRTSSTATRMRGVFSVTIMLLVALTIAVEAAKTKEKAKELKAEGECSYGRCVPNSGDCGLGVREAICKEQTKNFKCKVPCNWKKDFGADCKYKFGRWGECEAGTRSRSGVLRKALFNADCQETIKVNKPCIPKTPKPKGGEKKAKKGKEN